jgi:hypothetical protein
MMKVHGSCHCGHVRFEADVDPDKVGLCHCTDCQVSTGSAFRTNVPVPGNAFTMLSGEPTIYIKTTAESGNPRAQAFCPTCGTSIYSTTPGDGRQSSYMVRVGTLRERDQLVPKVQNWFRSALPWVTGIGALRKNEKGAT